MVQSLKQLNSILRTMKYNHPNEDCSEVAQRVKDTIKRGKLITIVAVLNNGQFTEFITRTSQDRWVYHTVVLLTLNGVDYVIDIDQTDKYQPAEQYIRTVRSINSSQIRVLMGDIGNRIKIGEFSQNLTNVKVLG